METLSFDVILDVSTLHLWFTCVRLPGSYLTHSLCAFSMTLTTPALDRRSSRWFEASPCRAASEGRPSISDAASFSSVRSSTSKPPLAFAAHPLAVLDVGFSAWHLLDVPGVDQQHGERALQHVPVGSERDAVRAFQPARFLAPPSEPDVRVSPASGSPRVHASRLRNGLGHGHPWRWDCRPLIAVACDGYRCRVEQTHVVLLWPPLPG